jgi:hypothetical protein
VASSWFLFFSYHNDARSNKHQRTQEYLKLNPAVAEKLIPVARGVKLNKKQEEEFSKSDYPMVDFNIE